MGVRTKHWGPHAWKYIHGLLNLLDQHKDNLKVVKQANTYIKNWIQQLPCIYCRKSLRTFCTQLHIPNNATNNETKDPYMYRRWGYKIHDKVNQKLMKQDIQLARTNYRNPNKWIQKWWKYRPTIQELDNIYPTPSSTAWWIHFFIFSFYMMCDFTEYNYTSCITLFSDTAHLLMTMNHPTGKLLYNAITNTNLFQNKNYPRTLQSRINYIKTIWNNMETLKNIPIPDINILCQQAIVKCNPKDKTKVGCH